MTANSTGIIQFMSVPVPEERPRTMAEQFPPQSYRRLRQLMDHGKGFRAPGPCAIQGCDYITSGWYCEDKPRSPVFTWDHCHAHDWVRGMLCRNHNSSWMCAVDARLENTWEYDQWPELVAHWHRCPRCADEGWRPLYRVDHAAGHAYTAAVSAAQRANRGIDHAELREIGSRAALLVNPSAVRGILGGHWCVPIEPA